MAQIRADTLEVPLCPPRLVLEPADVERQGTGGRTVECGCPEPCHFDRVNTLWEIMETFYSVRSRIKKAFPLIHHHWLP